ncbi:hypothetical protein BDQ17DRAFT_1385472 [Cyathus striatus]|nr:hypothetical protein BDQ17DRAFT_1385472 [Cyathus striatus]
MEEIETPKPKQGQIQVKVKLTSVCGTDLHALPNGTSMFPSAASPNAITGETLPVTLGHDICYCDGINPLIWPVGQKVVIEPIISCNMVDTCKACASGTKILCPLVSCIVRIAVNTENVYKLPITYPVTVAWHAVKRSNFKKSQTALILGAGPIGIFIMKALRAVDNTSKIIISEPSQFRRKLVEKHGATLAIDPYACDVSSIVKKEMGIGADFVFDQQGMIVMVSSWEKKPQVDMNAIVTKEVQLIGTCCYDGIHSEVLEAVETGKITGIEEMITMKIGLRTLLRKVSRACLKIGTSMVSSASAFTPTSYLRCNAVKILIHP